MNNETSALDEKIKSTKNSIERLTLQKNTLFNDLNDTKTQQNAYAMLLKERQEQMEVVKTNQASIMTRIYNVQSELDSKDRYIEREKKRIDALNDVIQGNQKELDETKSLRSYFQEQIKQVERDRKEYSKALIAYSRDAGIMDSNVKANKNSFQAEINANKPVVTTAGPKIGKNTCVKIT